MVSFIRVCVTAYMLCFSAIYLGVVGVLVFARTLIEEKRKISIGKFRMVGNKCDIETRFTEDFYRHGEITKNDSHVNMHKEEYIEFISKIDLLAGAN